MTWNSPFQPLQPSNNVDAKNYNQNLFDGIHIQQDHSQDNETYVDPDASLNTLLNCNSFLNDDPSLSRHPPINYNTDIPALDSLFSELNSDINFNGNDVNVGAMSEPVNLEEIERILLPQSNRRSSKKEKKNEKKNNDH